VLHSNWVFSITHCIPPSDKQKTEEEEDEDEPDEEEDEIEPEEEEDNDFQQVQAAVLRECILNLARIKEAISQNVGGQLDPSGLDTWQELMRGLKAGLLMLGKARAVEVIEGITEQLKRVMQPGGQGVPHDRGVRGRAVA